MPSSTATSFILGAGSTFSISTDGGTTYTPINQMKTVSFSGEKTAFDDITNMSSPNAFNEKVPTTIDSGTCSLSGVFDPHDAGQTALQAARIARTLCSCKLVLTTMTGDTTGFTRVFNAYVDAAPLSASFDKSVTIAPSFTITGGFTDTVPTPTA